MGETLMATLENGHERKNSNTAHFGGMFGSCKES